MLAPGGAPHTLAHPERPDVDRGAPCRASAPAGDSAARLGPGAWLSGTTRLPSGTGGRAGGRGREIRSHNIGLAPSPPQTFHRGWERRGQSRSLARIPATDRTARGTLTARSPSLARPSGPGAAGCRRCASRSRDPAKQPRGAQEGSPRTGVSAAAAPRAPAPVPPASGSPCPRKGTKRRLRGPAAPASRKPGLAHLLRAAPVPGRRPRVRLRPPSAPAPRRRLPARARQSSAAPLPPPLRPRPAPRPWARAPRATTAGAGSFSSAAAALRPLPLDVRLGGSSGGRGRAAKARSGGGCDPQRPVDPPALRPGARTSAPPGARTSTLPGVRPPRGSESRAAPQRPEGGGAAEGLRVWPPGTHTHPVFPKCPPKTPGGLGWGEGLPTLQLQERPRASHVEASIRGRHVGKPRRLLGRTRGVCLLAPNSASF